jgi:hypothetical protein
VNDCSPEIIPLSKLHCREYFTSRTTDFYGEAGAIWEEAGKRTGWSWRGRGSKRLCKDGGDNVGKHHLQAGARSNLQETLGIS